MDQGQKPERPRRGMGDRSRPVPHIATLYTPWRYLPVFTYWMQSPWFLKVLPSARTAAIAKYNRFSKRCVDQIRRGEEIPHQRYWHTLDTIEDNVADSCGKSERRESNSR